MVIQRGVLELRGFDNFHYATFRWVGAVRMF